MLWYIFLQQPSVFCNWTLFMLSFKNKCHLKKKKKKGVKNFSPRHKLFLPRAVFPNYPFLSSTPSSCPGSSTFQPSYQAAKSLGKSGPHTKMIIFEPQKTLQRGKRDQIFQIEKWDMCPDRWPKYLVWFRKLLSTHYNLS